MKMFNFLIFAAAVSFSSCNDAKRDDSGNVTNDSIVPVASVAQNAPADGGNNTILTTADVPDSVEMSFAAKYPKATKPLWMKYEPVESDDMPLDKQYYYVKYSNEGADYTSWYDNRGEWVKTSTRVTGNPNLPDAVNKTINAQYPGYTIVEIDKENDKNMEMYEVELKKGEEKAKLKILPDGKVFKRK